MLCVLWTAKVGHRHILQLRLHITFKHMNNQNLIPRVDALCRKRSYKLKCHGKINDNCPPFESFLFWVPPLVGKLKLYVFAVSSFHRGTDFYFSEVMRLGDTRSLQSHNTLLLIIKAKPSGDVMSNYENICRTKSLISYSHAFIMILCAVVVPQTAEDTGFGLRWTLRCGCLL